VGVGVAVVLPVEEIWGNTPGESTGVEEGTAIGVVEDVVVSACAAADVAAGFPPCAWDVVGSTPAAAPVELEVAASDEATTELPLAAGAAGALVSSALTQPVLAVRAAGQATCVKDTLGLSAPMNQSKRQ